MLQRGKGVGGRVQAVHSNHGESKGFTEVGTVRVSMYLRPANGGRLLNAVMYERRLKGMRSFWG